MPAPILKTQKKAQIQIGESIIVVIIIMIIAMFVLVFSTKMSKDKYVLNVEGYNELDAVATAQIVTNLYELKCAKEGLKATCIDIHKAFALAQVAQESNTRLYYYDLFKNARITLKEIYPRKINYTLYEVNASNTKDMQTVASIVIPVSIHNASSNKISFGILQIERFQKRIGI